MRTPPIRVRQRTNAGKLDKMSRLNYIKIYTVEHNVKVYDFGQVDKNDEVHLIANFNAVWGISGGLPDPIIESDETPVVERFTTRTAGAIERESVGDEDEDDDEEESGESDGTEKAGNPEEEDVNVSVSEGKRKA